MCRRIYRTGQHGVAALLFILVLLVGVNGWLVSGLSSARFEISQDKQTADALARAKEALIGRAAVDDNRPGSLPCPDTDNDGVAELFVGSNCPNYLGRVPWSTLDLPDLRDGHGERLWYALSANFRDHASAQPINSDKQGQLTVTGTNPANNVIAILFAAGPALASQVRDPVNVNVVTNYLEDENANGPPDYMTGIATAIFNDRALTIVADELFSIVEKRVVKEVEKALNAYFALPSGVFPPPAAFTDTTCLPTGSIGAGCVSNPSEDRGRVPVNATPSGWAATPATLIFLDSPTSWFHTNGWRQLVYYAPAYACTSPAGPNCTYCSTLLGLLDPRCSVLTGGGFVTLNVPPATPLANQKVVVIAAGRAIGSQLRGTDPEKTMRSNYVEAENSDIDNIYVRNVSATGFNDRAISAQ